MPCKDIGSQERKFSPHVLGILFVVGSQFVSVSTSKPIIREQLKANTRQEVVLPHCRHQAWFISPRTRSACLGFLTDHLLDQRSIFRREHIDTPIGRSLTNRYRVCGERKVNIDHMATPCCAAPWKKSWTELFLADSASGVTLTAHRKNIKTCDVFTFVVTLNKTINCVSQSVLRLLPM